MDEATVLVVDDSIDNLFLTQFLLEEAGYTVYTADGAEQVFAVLSTHCPNLILMDIQLPGIDGLELTRRLRRMTAWQEVPIVALTAYAMRGDEDRMRAAGCNGYIAKPIDTRTFAQIVRTYLPAQSALPLA
jgi:two-component system, cell cycle response regulator DivK